MVTTNPRQSQAVFDAIADPTRRRILGVLLGEGEQTVGRIAENFSISRPAISKHLRQLRKAGLVATRKRGAATLCQLNAQPLRAVSQWLIDYEAFWKSNLRNLKRHLEEKKP
jgi:DNA-binding transcriptional ArsR family regulator